MTNVPKPQSTTAEAHMTELSASRFLEEPYNPAFIRLTIWGVVVTLCGFIAWSSVTPVYEVVTGTGQIRPTGLTQQAEHLEGGIVAKVHVEEGDLVRQGEPLITLDRTTVRAELEKTRAETERLEQQLVRAEAFLQAYAAPEVYLDPTSAAEWSYRLAQIEVFRADREVLEAELVGLSAREAKSQDELEILGARAARLDRLKADGLVSTQELENVRREMVRLEGELQQISGERAVHQASISRSHAREAEMLASIRRDAAREVEALRENLAVASQTATQLSDRLNRTVITAPSTGVVQALGIQNIGQVVAQGAVVAEIVPMDTQVFAEIDVSADKINGVAPGRTASLKVLTHDFTRFGVIDATVERVSPTSVTLPDGSKIFRVRLVFDDRAMSQATSGQRRVTPGMTVTADIRTDRRTVLNYLLKPVRVIADRAMSEG